MKNTYFISIFSFILSQLITPPAHAILNRPPVSSEDFNVGGIIDNVVGIEGQKHGLSKDSFDCTGVILRPNIVLTAAHCFNFADKNKMKSNVSFGRVLGTNEVKIEKFEIHPMYDKNNPGSLESKSHDLALIKLSAEAELPFHAISKIIRADELIEDNATLEIAGYGQHFIGQKNRLRGSMFSFYSNLKEKTYLRWDRVKLFAQLDTPLSFAIDQRNGQGVCKGDSGSPLFHIKKNGDQVLIGITRSVGVFTKEETKTTPFCAGYGFFTDLRPHLDWIRETADGLQFQ